MALPARPLPGFEASQPSARPSSLRRLAASLIPLPIFVALATLLFAGAWTDPARLSIGDGVDAPLQMWFLGWLPFALTHGQNPFLTTYLDSQVGVNLMWNTSMPLAAALLWPITGTLGPVVAYNVMETLALATSAWCAFLAFRRYVDRYLPAVIGALLYGFSPYMLAHSLGHPVMTAACVPPLVLLVLDEIVVRQCRPPLLMGAALGLLGAAQLFIEEEVFAMMALLGIAGLILLAILNRDTIARRLPYVGTAAAAALGVFLALSAYPLAIQLFGPQRPTGILRDRTVFLIDLANFVIPTQLQALAPGWLTAISSRFSGQLTEWTAYLGLPLIAVLVYTAVRLWHNPVVRLASLLLALVALLSLGGRLHVGGTETMIPAVILALPLPLIRRGPAARFLTLAFITGWTLLQLVPVLRNLLPARLTLFLYLFAALLLAVFTDWALSRPWPRPRFYALAVFAVAVIPLLPAWPYPATPTPIPAFFTAGDVQALPAGSVALVVPFAYHDHAIAMLWQAASAMRFRMPEGEAFIPGTHQDPPPSTTQDVLVAIQEGRWSGDLNDVQRDRMRAELSAWRVRTVIVGPMDHESSAITLFTQVFGHRPVETDGVFAWFSLDQAR